MPKPLCQAGYKDKYVLHGFIRDRIEKLTEQWLLIAPKANPTMLEMFRDRDASPTRDLEPWAGEFAGKYLTSANSRRSSERKSGCAIEMSASPRYFFFFDAGVKTVAATGVAPGRWSIFVNLVCTTLRRFCTVQ